MIWNLFRELQGAIQNYFLLTHTPILKSSNNAFQGLLRVFLCKKLYGDIL